VALVWLHGGGLEHAGLQVRVELKVADARLAKGVERGEARVEALGLFCDVCLCV
jgi:hypothetical protein